jgi:hypothetical protein
VSRGQDTEQGNDDKRYLHPVRQRDEKHDRHRKDRQQHRERPGRPAPQRDPLGHQAAEEGGAEQGRQEHQLGAERRRGEGARHLFGIVGVDLGGEREGEVADIGDRQESDQARHDPRDDAANRPHAVSLSAQAVA